ncbi:alpha-L-rhamnosidase C-terminal domain-containing protein [Actinoallomurus soli]|uniref:alpha-L-rhamnosidase C-terminal domain-containing protein n=1 Tax=Actinoallomurus soli TaxID=2952535 RepID=UPI0020930AC5|nr:alpha-L-rhamnosidase C-terminal domain-containing protein [Actinoallomurus soli]MCO5974314.1 alpha-L-rhamnosidase [Actinoallomurus soli]
MNRARPGRVGSTARALLTGAVGAALVLPGAACAGPGGRQSLAANAVALSRTATAPDLDWRSHVLAVPGRYVRPRSVTVEGSAGKVTNPDGLRAEGGGTTTLTTTGDGGVRLIVDLGVLASGRIELGVRKASGAPIRMSYAEGRQFLGRWGDGDTDPDDFFYHGKTLGTDDDPDGRADVFKPTSHPTVLRSPGLRGSQRYIAITLDGPGTATFDFVRVRQTNRASAYDGHFLSSDPVLDRAWYASAYGIDLSTVRDTRKNPGARWVIVDGPKRDRVVYAEDLQLVAQAAYYQSGAYRRIVRDSLNLFACQQEPDGGLPAASRIDVPCDLGHPGPPDGSPKGFEPPGDAGMVRLDSFTAWWVVALDDYLRYTGDARFVKSMLPVARRAVRLFAAHPADGVLFRTGTYAGKPGYNWHPPDKADGVDAYTNEAYYGALRALASLERSVAGDAVAARSLDARATKVRAAILRTFWDAKAGAMLLNTDDPRRTHSSDANSGALAFGLLSPEQAKSAMAFLKRRLGTPYGTATGEYPDDPYMTRQLSPYIMARESLGRFEYGDGTGALSLIRTAWNHMIENGPGTPWEQSAADGTPGGAGTGTGGGADLAHAWSTAVPALSMDVLGVRPVSDGYARWTVSPDPVDLSWAQGTVPVPGGAISTAWKRGKDDGSFTLSVAAPEHTTGRVAIPTFHGDRTIAMDGRIAWRDGHPVRGVHAHREGDRIVFEQVRGGHTFAWSA